VVIYPYFFRRNRKIYIKNLLKKGYKPADERSKALLIAKQIIKDDEVN
jgi:hypothetical protein